MAEIQQTPKRVARLIVSDTAWVKMKALVESFDIEVQWHGIAKRGRRKDEYILKDIVLFPHKITAVSGESNQDEYEKWLDTLPDKTINNLRFHGHSHVFMSVSPSGFDMEYRKSLLKTIPTSSFYIFMILNKQGNLSCEIYNESKSYDKIRIIFKCRNGYLDDFISKAKELAVPDSLPWYDEENFDTLEGENYGHK